LHGGSRDVRLQLLQPSKQQHVPVKLNGLI